jgi:hypothetical protein
MNRLFPVTSICRCRKRCSDELTFTVERIGRNEFTVANTHFPVLCIVRNVEIFIEGLLGTTAGNIPRYGDA